MCLNEVLVTKKRRIINIPNAYVSDMNHMYVITQQV